MSVFANGREVSGKAQPNKIIAGFPSVCLSPPSPPAGPIPIPYPMFTDAKKTTSGTTKVKIKKKEVGKKNSSTYKKSKGNEAATRSFGMDVVSHTLSGKTKHQAYSFNVKAQGAGVDRFGDLTTTNHMSPATAITVNAAGMDMSMITDLDNPCEELGKKNKDARDDMKKHRLKEVQNAGNQSTTVTHSVFTPSGGGEPQIARACSRKVMTRDETWSKGVAIPATQEGLKNDEGKPVKTPLKSDICPGNQHTYRQANPYNRPHNSHTESRILEDLFAKHKDAPRGPDGKIGKVVMHIDWQRNVKDKAASEKAGEKVMKQISKKKACAHCKRLLCKAQSCFDILLCNEEGEPVKPKCPK